MYIHKYVVYDSLRNKEIVAIKTRCAFPCTSRDAEKIYQKTKFFKYQIAFVGFVKSEKEEQAGESSAAGVTGHQRPQNNDIKTYIMDLKKSEKTTLEAIKPGAATIVNIIEETAYKERTVKAALKKLHQLKLVDFLEGEDGEKIYFEMIQDCEKIADDLPPCTIEEQPVAHLRKLDFLNVQEGHDFSFRGDHFFVEEIIQQKAIAGKAFLKMLATNGIKNFEFTVNLGRAKAPISFKEL